MTNTTAKVSTYEQSAFNPANTINQDPREFDRSEWEAAGYSIGQAIKAIRRKCLDCCNGQPGEVKKCTVVSCELFPLRMGGKPQYAKPTPSLEEPDGFSEFWAAYPKKVDKGRAVKAYRVALKKVLPAVILDGARTYCTEQKWEDPQYTKHPTTWLNAEAWANEPAATDRLLIAARDRKAEVSIFGKRRY